MIEPTPILYGDDARRLLEEVRTSKYSQKKQKFLDECRDVYESYEEDD